MARVWKTHLRGTGKKWELIGRKKRRWEEGGSKSLQSSKGCYRRSVFTTVSVVKGLEIVNTNCSAQNKKIQTMSLEKSF